MTKKPKNYYYKIITFTLLLATIPVIIVGLFSYLKSSEVIQNNVAEEKLQSIYQIQTNIEQVLKTVDHSLTYFVSTNHLNQILREPLTPYQFQLYNQAKKELSSLQTKETGVEDIILVSLQERWAINNQGLQRLTDEENTEIYHRYVEEPQGAAWVLEKNEETLFTNSRSNTCTYHLNLVKHMPFTSSNKTGMAIAKIPACSFNDIIAVQPETETTIILDDKFQVVGHSNFSQISDDFSELDYLNQLKSTEEKTGQFNVDINGTVYKITYRKSNYNNWTYVSLISVSNLNQQSSSIGWFTLIICSVFLFFSLIFSLIGSRRIYKPIHRLQEMVSKGMTSKTGSEHKSEFELIEDRIHYMLDQNVQLESKLQGQVTQLKQFFTVKLLQGKVSEHEIQSKMLSYGYNQEWKRLCVLTVQIDSLEESMFNVKEEDLLLFAINTMVEDFIPSEVRLTPIVKNHTQVTIIQSNHQTDEEYTLYLNNIAQEIQTKVKEELNLPISIGISLPYEKLINTGAAYKEGVEALKYRIKFDQESIIFFENLERGTAFHTYFPKQIENAVFDAIKVCDKEKVDEELNKLLRVILEKNLNHTQYRISIVRFLNNLLELMQTLGIDVLELEYKMSMFDQLYELKTLKEIENWFKDIIIYPLINNVEERTNSQYKNLSDKIIHIVQQEFDSDITLESIATRLHYNPNYLSSIFRKETNMSFSEYLSLYRLTTAKQWLEETDMSVREISEKLKYTNSQNFIRSFKKIEGTTPGKYRDLKRAQ
ncbi:helix-turn-helix domain-containing protein [Sutcliffiella rhizosphaerae]|uniref:HTH-type transcriptional regulator YesS n=1 Tax=Sutcliffiella rhizosphaerae TaxID=2880967 RepID=A0ABM8YM45_9BACI|nr:helix-turn-helix domain-containing protein [Sutcliffiella rhizosphaerae]CAG9620947.1 HTH-type transcriptional regulator YesS [Sutcliffiella rhizosphaerae]